VLQPVRPAALTGSKRTLGNAAFALPSLAENPAQQAECA
jgi:hypothetical protein